MAKTQKNILITSQVQITTKRLKDLLCCAFEGGSNFWASCSVGQEEMDKVDAEYFHEIPALGGEIEMFDKEEVEIAEQDGDEKPKPLGVINIERIAMALQWMADGTNEKGKDLPHYKRHFNDIVIENEDANTGDLLVQLAVMGEEVFG